LPVENHSEDSRPVQFLVWACVETVDAAISAITASNIEGTNLRRARGPDAAPRHGVTDDRRCGSCPI
jgi:hypothetical protein